MPHSSEKPAVYVALDELNQQAVTPEDKALVAQWAEEADAERAEALTGMRTANLGHVALQEQRDGSLAPVHEVEEVRAAGQELAGPYNHDRRA